MDDSLNNLRAHESTAAANPWPGPRPALAVGGAALILVATVISYSPVLRCGFIWDDDFYVTENLTLLTIDGLRDIWLRMGSTYQYYPLVHTTFWVEHHLWGEHPFGYHLINILLHSCNGILLWVLLRRLGVPGAFWAGAIFALHPVHVESVAWITERKNVLSTFFYLAAALAYFRHRPPVSGSAEGELRGRGWYLLSYVLFLCALWSKTVTATLPAALLLVSCWRHRRFRAEEALRLVPFVATGVGFGLLVSWMEVHVVGTQGEVWDLSLPERCIVASRAAWFYLGKLVWPAELIFFYPRWTIDATRGAAYLAPAASVAVVAALFLLRRRVGPGPLVAVLFFAGTLFPTSGFFPFYAMQFSFVADHWQYHASMGLIALVSAVGVTCARRGGRRVARFLTAAGVGVLLLAGARVWTRCPVYQNSESLWRDTILQNPDAWLAQHNLAAILVNRGNQDELSAAIDHFDECLRVRPDHVLALDGRATARLKAGDPQGALEDYTAVVAQDPGLESAHYGRALAYRELGRLHDALIGLDEALHLRPGQADWHNERGNLRHELGDLSGAIDDYDTAVRLAPQMVDAYYNRGLTRARRGEVEEAIIDYGRVFQLQSIHPDAYNARGNARMALGDLRGALEDFDLAIQQDPEHAEALNNRGMVRYSMGDVEGALADYHRALEGQPDFAEAAANLGLTLHLEGNFEGAVDAYGRAIEAAPADWTPLLEIHRLREDAASGRLPSP